MVSVAFGLILICEKKGGGEWGVWREISWVPIATRLEFASHRGNYFVLDGGTGTTSVVDPRSLKEVSVIPSAHGNRGGTDTSHCRYYLVESSSREELYLVVTSQRTMTTEGRRRFEVFRLDCGSGGSDRRWIEVRSIGEDMMFVDYRNVVALSARDFHGRRGDCIYFVDYGARVTCPSLFDVGSGGVEEVPYCWDDSRRRWKHHGWIIPTM